MTVLKALLVVHAVAGVLSVFVVAHELWVAEYENPSAPYVTLSPDGKMCCASTHLRTLVYDSVTGERRAAFPYGHSYSAFSDDATTLGIVSYRDSIAVYDTRTLTTLWHAIGTLITFSPTQNHVAVWTQFCDHTTRPAIELRARQTGRLQRLIPTDLVLDDGQYYTRQLHFSPSGRVLLAVGTDFYDANYKCVAWDVSTGTVLFSSKGNGHVASIRFSRNGRSFTVLTQDHEPLPTATLDCRSCADGRLQTSVTYDASDVIDVFFPSQDAPLLVLSDGVHDTLGGGTHRFSETGAILCASFNDILGELVLAGQNGVVIVWDIATGTLKRSIVLRELQGELSGSRMRRQLCLFALLWCAVWVGMLCTVTWTNTSLSIGREERLTNQDDSHRGPWHILNVVAYCYLAFDVLQLVLPVEVVFQPILLESGAFAITTFVVIGLSWHLFGVRFNQRQYAKTAMLLAFALLLHWIVLKAIADSF